MSSNNSDFFSQKKPWSFYKDDLLRCYLMPYFTKILCTYRDLLYVDCFAGKGKFDDGNDGSPLIALKCLKECKECKERKSKPQIKEKCVFIELNYANYLETNIYDANLDCDTKVIPGRFEDNIESVVSMGNGNNVFLYLDPYGIKALNMNLFQNFPKKCSTIELLINR